MSQSGSKQNTKHLMPDYFRNKTVGAFAFMDQQTQRNTYVNTLFHPQLEQLASLRFKSKPSLPEHTGHFTFHSTLLLLWQINEQTLYEL